MMFVLASFVAVLIGPCAPSPVHNLNLKHILDLTKEYSKALHEHYFVEDVTDLANNGCGNKFFCKVHDILSKHHRSEDEKIVRNLDVFLNETQVNCKEELKNVKASTNERPILVLLTKLDDCIHRRNFTGK